MGVIKINIAPTAFNRISSISTPTPFLSFTSAGILWLLLSNCYHFMNHYLTIMYFIAL